MADWLTKDPNGQVVAFFCVVIILMIPLGLALGRWNRRK